MRGFKQWTRQQVAYARAELELKSEISAIEEGLRSLKEKPAELEERLEELKEELALLREKLWKRR